MIENQIGRINEDYGINEYEDNPDPSTNTLPQGQDTLSSQSLQQTNQSIQHNSSFPEDTPSQQEDQVFLPCEYS